MPATPEPARTGVLICWYAWRSAGRTLLVSDGSLRFWSVPIRTTDGLLHCLVATRMPCGARQIECAAVAGSTVVGGRIRTSGWKLWHDRGQTLVAPARWKSATREYRVAVSRELIASAQQCFACAKSSLMPRPRFFDNSGRSSHSFQFCTSL